MCPPSQEKQRLLDRSTVDLEADSRTRHPDVTTSHTPTLTVTMIIVALYVLSGCSQPILMTVLRQAGLADSNCQLYMLFYYLGTASAIFTVPSSSSDKRSTSWPSKRTLLKACGIAVWDIAAQTMNYTGAALTGPTIFAIVYSSVTIWAAIYSQTFLGRTMNAFQWYSVLLVFGGLALTATDTMELGSGSDIVHGLLLVVAGSSMHGLFYVMSEAVMTPRQRNNNNHNSKPAHEDRALTVPQNCAVQGMTASACFLAWQVVYTLPRIDERLREPMQLAGTSLLKAFFLLVVFGAMSFVHSITFYHTLRHLPGGATSAGVFKGLQAVLVFLLTHLIFCHRVGGAEMCFTTTKFLSLVTVTGGVGWYGHATSQNSNNINNKSDAKKKLDDNSSNDGGSSVDSYNSIQQNNNNNDDDEANIEIEPLAGAATT